MFDGNVAFDTIFLQWLFHCMPYKIFDVVYVCLFIRDTTIAQLTDQRIFSSFIVFISWWRWHGVELHSVLAQLV
jgi:hypothetical protein